MFDRLKVARRLDDALDRLTKCEQDLRNLQLEWSDTYDKLRKTMLRVVKRTEREPIEVPPDAAQAELPGLSARAVEHQQRILARRNRMPTRSEQ